MFKHAFILFITFYTLFSLSSLAAQPTEIERGLTDIVDSNNGAALDLLKELININSGTMHFAGVKRVGDIFREELDQLGFKTRWIDGSAFNRSGHLFAEHDGKGKHLLLIGHLDTVFEPDSPFQKYQMVSENMMKGPGICDMKGGDVIIVYALKALKEAGLLQNMHITVALIGDEENAGSPIELARYDLIEAAKKADISIGFENGDGDPTTAVISRRGASSWKLTVEGKAAHSSQIFKKDVGAGAIFETSRILNQFYKELATEKYLTFNPGLILGGTDVKLDAKQSRGSAFGKNNVVAGQTIVSGDLRAISPEQLKQARTKMRRIVEDHLPETSSKIEFWDHYPPLAPTAGNKELLGIYDTVSRDLGFGPVKAVDPSKAGAADVSFTAAHVEMVIDGLGFGGTDDHSPNETGDLRTLPMQTKRAAILLYRLSKQN
jgi:glutamate carboxypeptidase